MAKTIWKPTVIFTERLMLRPIDAIDAKDIFSYAQNPNVSKYTLWEPHRTLADSQDFIRRYVTEHYQNKEPEPLAITLKDKPTKVIGTVGCFWKAGHEKSMELAYALSEEFWGQGIATEAANAIVEFCFREFELDQVQARCKVDNLASARVMQKIGMTFDQTIAGDVFHRGQKWDMHYYSKIRNFI